MYQEERALSVSARRSFAHGGLIALFTCAGALTSIWSAAAVAQETAAVPRFELGAEASHYRLHRGMQTRATGV